jgi:hypothetical protein
MFTAHASGRTYSIFRALCRTTSQIRNPQSSNRRSTDSNCLD